MRPVYAVSLLCAAIIPVQAADQHDWYVLKTDQGVYAYDADDVIVDSLTEYKTVSINTGTGNGYTTAIVTIDCRRHRAQSGGGIFADNAGHETLLMVEGNEKTMRPVSEGGELWKLAEDVACKRKVAGAVHVDSQEVASEQLKPSN